MIEVNEKLLSELVELAEEANPGLWEAEVDDGEGSVVLNTGTALTKWSEGGVGYPARSWRTADRLIEVDDIYDEDLEQFAHNAEYIAAARPEVVLALIARIREMEAK